MWLQVISMAQTGQEISSDMLKNADLENVSPPNMEGLEDLISMARPQQTPSSDALVHTNGTSPQLQAQSAQWFSQKAARKSIPAKSVTSIIDGLKKLYIEKLKPLEIAYRFNDFVSPLLTASDFDAKPQVMLLGQYSTGKTTFIKHLLQASYPGTGNKIFGSLLPWSVVL
jgi:EH domain-containing protein 1